MTQCDRILDLLADGAPHTHHEFYGFCVLHSRISELRKRGHSIVCWREGDDYLYRLQDSGTEPDGQPPQKVAPPEQDTPVDVVAIPLWPMSSVPDIPEQLRLVA